MKIKNIWLFAMLVWASVVVGVFSVKAGDTYQTFVVSANGAIGASRLAVKPKSFSRDYRGLDGTVRHEEVTGYQDVSSSLNYDGTKTITVHTYSVTNSYSYKYDNRRIPEMYDDPRGPKAGYVSGFIPMKPSVPRFGKRK